MSASSTSTSATAPAEFRDRLFDAVRVDAVHESSIEFDCECRDEADEVVAAG